MGTDVIEEFYKMRHKFVVVSNDNTTVLSWVKHRERILYIDDDPADDEVLIRAGIDKAKGLVSALGEDPENLFVVLSARQLNSKLRIVSQAVDRSSIPKLRKAGADIASNSMHAVRSESTAHRLLRELGNAVLEGECIYTDDSPIGSATNNVFEYLEDQGC